MEYNPKQIEPKWQQYWKDNKVYKTEIDHNKPKYYTLDMFPYPSGAGLHVGHPLGYIASDIVSRYKKLKGFNVLHPMGFDSFGLPAEQYAIDTGQHPAITTEKNIATFKEQLNALGFSYDWDNEVQTSSPEFYRWTQWIFKEIFNSWYNNRSNKAESIDTLISIFEKEGNQTVDAACDEDTEIFTAEDWSNFDEEKKQITLLQYRLTYSADAMVNWCPTLGTVLANDEVKDGLSERGGYPVERKLMKQWMMRITAYADRLLTGLDKLDWSDSLKGMQSNWIGKSYGAELSFEVSKHDLKLKVFTTRPDTIFGVTYVVLAPEHELISTLTTSEQEKEVGEYVTWAKNRSERERMSEVKTVSGVFTGSYCQHPFKDEQIPIWVADYVLAGYGTGIVMAVPSSDDRDYRFAKNFDLPIINVIEGTEELENPTEKKVGNMINSDFLNGKDHKEAIQIINQKLEERGIGKGKVNFRLRDAVFSRQRYWGEPVPMYFKNGIPYPIKDEELPLHLPKIDKYLPTSEGEPPLGRAEDWKYEDKHSYELTTMPGWAGSSWYFLRYMDAKNETEFASKEATNYWNSVDFYLGGTEHAVGHLLYSRFWTKFLCDRGYISFDEPFKKLVNQGMIQGRSSLLYRIKNENKYVSADLKDQYETSELYVDINLVKNDILDIEGLKKWRSQYADAKFISSENGNFYCGHRVEKMSKSKFNTQNPNEIIEKYSADTLRLYEMFLGPLEHSKPWDTSGIDGVHKFLRKFWRLFLNKAGEFAPSDAKASPQELKVLHKTIKKIAEDIENQSFNTSIPAFMICVNELASLKCNKVEILKSFLILLSPFAPHISEELWHQLGETESIVLATYPEYKEEYLKEDAHQYPISINGKVRTKMSFALDLSKEEVEKAVLENPDVQKWVEGKQLRKFIFVPKRIVNLVV